MPEFSGPSIEQWQYLRQNTPVVEDVLSEKAISLDGEDTPATMAIDSAGSLHLLIPVSQGPLTDLPPDLSGLKIRHRRLDRGEVLDLFAPPAHEPVFTPFCRRLLYAIFIESRLPWAAVSTELRSWASAFKPGKSEFSRITQIGLFGELWILLNVIIPYHHADSIDMWTGPDRERHDLVGKQAHIEVKTTTRSEPQYRISRTDQLTPPEDKELYIAAIQLEESKGSKHSVVCMIDKIKQVLHEDAAALDLFMGKLFSIGWYDELRHSVELLNFSLKNVEFYRVDTNFPRLPPDISIRSGIRNIEYDINLSNISALDKSEIIALVRDLL